MAYRSDESKEEEIWLFDRETGNKRKLTTHESFKTIDALVAGLDAPASGRAATGCS